MTYDTVATVSQVSTLLFFIGLFLLVLGYVFWPGNRAKFDKASRAALDLDKKNADNSRDQK
jgi:cytochrome c oxidase cbb3-type subunit IV